MSVKIIQISFYYVLNVHSLEELMLQIDKFPEIIATSVTKLSSKFNNKLNRYNFEQK